MSVIPVIGVGAGGHAKVLMDILRQDGRYEIVGLVDPRLVGQSIAGVAVMGGDEQLEHFRTQGVTAAFIGIGGVGDNTLRRRVYEQVRAAGFVVVNAVHPRAIVAPSVHLDSGIAIMAGAILNPDTHLGDNVIVNTGAIVDHDCHIGAHTHISPGAVLAGGVRTGVSAHIGVGATVRQGIVVGDGAVVGAGAVVIRNVPPGEVVVGVPARHLRDVAKA